MRSRYLRTFRILFSSLLLVAFIAIFADLKSLVPSKYINILTWFQFIPSILKFADLRSVATAGFAAIMILAILTGRTYCSFLCPLGTVQDIFGRIGGRFRRKFRRYGFKKPHTIVRYSILAGTILVVIFWGIYLLTLLDPYSIFGRFMTYFGRPVTIVFNNLVASVLHKFDIYTLSHIASKNFPVEVYLVPLLFLLLVGTLSLAKGRLFCNMICPAGTLLGLLSKISVFRIRVDETKCNKCGRCSVNCKSSCIDSLKNTVDKSRCVVCFNCIRNCPERAISYGIVKLKKKTHETDAEKRKLIATAIALLLGIPQIIKSQDRKAPVPKKESTVRESRKYPVSPPGSGGIADLNKDCTACSLCISACPNDVLRPAFLEYGLAGMMQPVMDYSRSFCTYNCVRCTEVCPTYALQPLVLEAKKLVQIGKSNFIKDNCIVKTEKTACGACSEACPTKAVYMVPYEGNLVIPEVNNEICVGCGHCEFACPTKPFKAIFVDGNPVHLAAKKPENKQSEIKTPVEFPF